jgi:transposase
MTETLNLDYHRSLLVVKALNKAKTIKQAATLLGVTRNTVYSLINYYRVEFDEKEKK